MFRNVSDTYKLPPYHLSTGNRSPDTKTVLTHSPFLMYKREHRQKQRGYLQQLSGLSSAGQRMDAMIPLLVFRPRSHSADSMQLITCILFKPKPGVNAKQRESITGSGVSTDPLWCPNGEATGPNCAPLGSPSIQMNLFKNCVTSCVLVQCKTTDWKQPLTLII